MINPKDGLKQLAEKIWYFEGFLSQEEIQTINNIAKDKETTPHPFDEHSFSRTDVIPELFDVWKKVSDLLYPTHVVHPYLSLLTYQKGSYMEPHCDSPGEGNHDKLTVPDAWSTCTVLDYGVCVYFGDYTGGEVYYPNQNIEISVKPGDLLIHGALSEYQHGVKEITSGVRYSYSNFALPLDKSPGTFPKYKSKDYERLTSNEKDLLTIWAAPQKENTY